MVRCVAFGCGNISFEGCLIHFHKFPSDRPDIRKQWISFCKRFIIACSGGACNDVDVDYQSAVKKQFETLTLFVCVTPESNPTPKAAAKLAREKSAEKRRHREVNSLLILTCKH